jgi:DNA segregation ATPase FtsK/SpoIIIE-like protein
LPAWAKTDPKPSSTAAEEILRGATPRFAIALDATWSMAGLIDMAKNSITEILRRVIAGAGRPVEIMLVVYRDYDVPDEIVETSTVTKDANALTAWLNRVRAPKRSSARLRRSTTRGSSKQ